MSESSRDIPCRKEETWSNDGLRAGELGQAPSATLLHTGDITSQSPEDLPPHTYSEVDPLKFDETDTTSIDRRRKSKQRKEIEWANEKLDQLLGYGRFQKFQAWVFIGLVSFVGSMNYFHPMFLVTKKMHRCALPEKLEKR